MSKDLILKYLKNGQTFLELEDYQGAMRAFNIVIGHDHHHPEAMLGFSKANIKLGHLEVLMALYEGMVESWPPETKTIIFNYVYDLQMDMQITDDDLKPKFSKIYYEWLEMDTKMTSEKYLHCLQQTQENWKRDFASITAEVESIDDLIPIVKDISSSLYSLVHDSKEFFGIENTQEWNEGVVGLWEQLLIPSFTVVDTFFKGFNLQPTDIEEFNNYCQHNEQFQKILEQLFILYLISEAIEV